MGFGRRIALVKGIAAPPTPVRSYPNQVRQNLTGAPARTFLDEAGFQQLLAAAFVVQQHNDRLRLVKGPGAAYTRTLSEIVETEGQIKNGRLNLTGALRLIAERARKLARAEAAAFALLDGSHLVYRATSGRCADQVGSRVVLTAALAVRCLRTGTVLQSPDTSSDRNLNTELCWSKGVRALIAAPVLYHGKPVGVLELRFANPNEFREEDVRTCELMAGLVALALSNEWDAGRQKLLAARDESAMTQAIEKFAPQMARILDDPEIDFAAAGAALSGKIMGENPPVEAARSAVQQTPVQEIRGRDATAKVSPTIEGVVKEFPARVPAPESVKPETSRPDAAAPGNFTKDILSRSGTGHEILAQGVLAPEVLKGAASGPVCQNCGREFVDDEMLCGTCGTERTSQPAADPAPQASTWTSLWDLQESSSSDGGNHNGASAPEAGAAASNGGSSAASDAQENRASFLEGLHELRARFLGKPETVKEKGEVAEPQAAEAEPARPEVSRFEVARFGGKPEAKPEVDHAPSSESNGNAAARSALEEFQRRAAEEEAEKAAPELSSFSTQLPEVSAEAEILPWTERPGFKQVHEFWAYHRATIYLCVAAILLLMVLLGWDGAPPPSQSAASPQTASAATDDLTLLDKLLISTGLAEAPAAPAYAGNPDTKVWVDVHTALYYCPGTDLYGKTKGGRYASQKDAQQDAFEPAANRACK